MQTQNYLQLEWSPKKTWNQEEEHSPYPGPETTVQMRHLGCVGKRTLHSFSSELSDENKSGSQATFFEEQFKNLMEPLWVPNCNRARVRINISEHFPLQ